MNTKKLFNNFASQEARKIYILNKNKRKLNFIFKYNKMSNLKLFTLWLKIGWSDLKRSFSFMPGTTRNLGLGDVCKTSLKTQKNVAININGL